MTALITLAHGSRHPEAATGIRELTRAAATQLGVDYVDAHLDFNTPTLTDAAARLSAQGHTEAVVVPLLFTDAYHARVDVPAAVVEAAGTSGLDLTLAETLGQGSDIAEILARRVALDAHPEATVVLYPVGTSRPAAAAATEELAREVGSRTGHHTHVVAATGPGGGAKGLEAIAVDTPRVHLLPLLVTHGTLLDDALRHISALQDATGTVVTHSAPLLTDLAPVIATRYCEAQLTARNQTNSANVKEHHVESLCL